MNLAADEIPLTLIDGDGEAFKFATERLEGDEELAGLRLYRGMLTPSAVDYIIAERPPSWLHVVGVDNDGKDNQEDNYYLLVKVVDDVARGRLLAGFVFAIGWKNNAHSPRPILEQYFRNELIDYIRVPGSKGTGSDLIWFWSKEQREISKSLRAWGKRNMAHTADCDCKDCHPYGLQEDLATAAYRMAEATLNNGEPKILEPAAQEIAKFEIDKEGSIEYQGTVRLGIHLPEFGLETPTYLSAASKILSPYNPARKVPSRHRWLPSSIR